MDYDLINGYICSMAIVNLGDISKISLPEPRDSKANMYIRPIH